MTAAPDAYRSKLHATIAALRYWVPQLRSAADIHIGDQIITRLAQGTIVSVVEETSVE